MQAKIIIHPNYITAFEASIPSKPDGQFVHIWILDAGRKDVSRKTGSGHKYLLHLLSKYSGIPELEIKLEHGIYGKPQLIRQTDLELHFNISYSYNKTAICISDREVGVDIEHLDMQIKFGDLGNHIFSETELIELYPLNFEKFYKAWTIKESFLKAIGLGLSVEPNFIPSTEGTHLIYADLNLVTKNLWNVYTTTVDDNVLSITTEHDFSRIDHFLTAFSQITD